MAAYSYFDYKYTVEGSDRYSYLTPGPVEEACKNELSNRTNQFDIWKHSKNYANIFEKELEKMRSTSQYKIGDIVCIARGFDYITGEVGRITRIEEKGPHVHLDNYQNPFTVSGDYILSWDEIKPFAVRATTETKLKGEISRRTSIDYHTIFGMPSPTEIKSVKFNPPATIVFWADGTKTVVKCMENDEFDPEKGLAMAITKKIYGNKHDYYEKIFFKYLPKEYRKKNKEKSSNPMDDVVNAFNKLGEALTK